MAHKHPTSVIGFNAGRRVLPHRVLLMRYDCVRDFFADCDAELRKEAVADQGRGYAQLAGLLLEAAEKCAELCRIFERIWKLSEKHMRD